MASEQSVGVGMGWLRAAVAAAALSTGCPDGGRMCPDGSVPFGARCAVRCESIPGARCAPDGAILDDGSGGGDVAEADASDGGGEPRDVAVDAPGPCDDGGCAAPRQIAPLSTATVTSQRPQLRWVLPEGVREARVELCRERACTTVVETIDAAGDRATPSRELSRGVWFWRVRGRAGAQVGTQASPVWQFYVGARSAPVNSSYGTTLDVNGDGFADLAVGAPDAVNGRGKVYLFLGSAAGVARAPTTTLLGPDGGQHQFGTAVASAGDVNGDGFGDLVVAAARGVDDRASAHIYLGGAAGIGMAPDVTVRSPDADTRSMFTGVTSAGDVNGDGYADILASAFRIFDGQGRAYLYPGGSSGPMSSLVVPLTAPDSQERNFAVAIDGAGDLNADGFADIVVGQDVTADGVGRVFIYQGTPSGVDPSAFTMRLPPMGVNGFGRAISAVGDVTGDGYSDVLVAASSGGGSVHLHGGGPGGVSMLPITGANAGGGTDAADFGRSVSSETDINLDGFADVVVGHPARDSAGWSQIFIYFGNATGFTRAPSSPIRTGPGIFLGSVVDVGDLSGDGIADVLSNGRSSMSGSEVRIHFGSRTDVSPDYEALSVPNGSYEYFGRSFTVH